MFGCNTHLLKHIKQAILAWSFRQNIILGCYPVFAAISARGEFIVWGLKKGIKGRNTIHNSFPIIKVYKLNVMIQLQGTD